jgi:hypothetical protein
MKQNDAIFLAGGNCGMSPDLFSKWVDLNVDFQRSNLYPNPPVLHPPNIESGDQCPLPFEDEKKQELENS